MSDYMVCVLGSGGVGKSCLTIQFVQGIFAERYNPTIEDVYRTTIEIDEKRYTLEIFDTAGTDEFSAMKDLYIKDADGFVIVYSITTKATFNDIQDYYNRIVAVKNVDTYGKPAIVLVGNKIDLENERAVTREAGQALARNWNCTFLEASSRDQATVTEIFYDLVRQMNRKGPVTRPNKPTKQQNTELSTERVEIHIEKSTSGSKHSAQQKWFGCCLLL